VGLFPLVKDTLKHYFPKEDTYQQLDSLYKNTKSMIRQYRQRREDDDRD
jgi:hypothetical protein